MFFSSKLNVSDIILGAIGFSIILIVSLDRNSYNSTTQFWFDAPLEIIESPVETNVFTVICHGYAGSKEMMRQIAFDVNKGGNNVVLFDFIGHGKNRNLLINAPNQLSGTTQQLVDQLESVIENILIRYGPNVEISLIGHSMASDIVIRAAKNKNVTSVIAISPYSTAITETFPRDLLLISGQFETHLRTASLEHMKNIEIDATENRAIINGDFRRKASSIKNAGHVSVLYAPQTSRQINEWLGLETSYRSILKSHILWIALSAILLLRFISRLIPNTFEPPPTQRARYLTLLFIMFSACLYSAPSAFLQINFLPVYGFTQLALFFGLYALHIALFCKWLRLDLNWKLDFKKLCLIIAFFIGIVLFVNEFIGSFNLTGYRIWVFFFLLLPVTFFCIYSEQIIQLSRPSLAFFLRLTPLVGIISLLVVYPQNLILMFTTIPIYIFYFTVFGYVGKFFSRHSDPLIVGLSHGAFLSYSFAATNPLFALP